MSESDKSLGERNYEQFAARYAAAAETKPHNALYERPATLSLVGEVQGFKVLDAGCGPGICSEWLLRQGAEVVACDVTPQMIEIARARIERQLPEALARFSLHRADLRFPLHFAPAASFDLVLCALVLDYIEPWQPVFEEFFRVLRPGGALVFSCGHPTGDFLYVQRRQLTEGNYFRVEPFTAEWRGFGEPYPRITSYRRPLEAIFTPLLRSGFVLSDILEPTPTAEYARADPHSYAILMREPGFLCVRARRPDFNAPPHPQTL